MNEVINWLNESVYINSLSPACQMCANGSKLVLLITGYCPLKCYYCPISYEKGGTDCIFADEWKLDNENDFDKLIQEAKYIEATGAGITGGDPLVVWKRTKKYISLLKDVFGSGFHIHLYTSGVKNGKYLNELVSEGLDEIRFHPSVKYWNCMSKNPILKIIKNSIETEADIAIEIPSIPHKKEEIMSLIKWANKIGIKWININELEFSERNANNLIERGLYIKNDISSAIKESQNTAIEIIKTVNDNDLEIGIHYCSCSFKDGIQLKNRIKRRAINIAKKNEIITKDGTLIKGIIQPTLPINLNTLYKKLKQEFNINNKDIYLNNVKKRIEMEILLLNKIASNLLQRGIESYMIEEYPTADGLEVERIPLPVL